MKLIFLKSIISTYCLFLVINSVVAETRGLHRQPLSALTKQGENISLYQQSHALLIGVSDYTDGWSDLAAIPRELDAVQAALEKQNFNVIRINNPNGKGLQSAFENFIDDYGYDEDNRLLFFFSGHGHSDEKSRHGFLIPSDAPLPSHKKEFRRSALEMNQIMAWARNIEAKHALFIFDSCFSGSVFKAKNIPRESERYIRGVTSQPVRQFITAGSAGETVPAQSTFTPAFVDAIDRGVGDLNDDGYITGSELGLYLSQTIPQHVDQNPQYGKIRDYDLSKGDFVFFGKVKPLPLVTVSQDLNTDASTSSDNVELIYWQSAERAGTLAAFKLYLDKYPNGAFADLAKLRMGALAVVQAESEVSSTSSNSESPNSKLDQKLKECAGFVQQNKLTTGKGGNALDCYNSILKEYKTNVDAAKGIKSIEQRYLQLANGALSKGDSDKASTYVRRLAKVNPASKELARLKAKIEELVTEDVQSILMGNRRKKSTTGHYSN